MFFFFPEIINELEPSEEATKAVLIIILIVLALLPICLFLSAYKIKKKNYDAFVKYKDYLGVSWNTKLSSAFNAVLKPLGILLIVGILIVGISAISRSCSNALSSVEKKRCGWCGKEVYEYNMSGIWCNDCQEKAFGEDGWYDKIKD